MEGTLTGVAFLIVKNANSLHLFKKDAEERYLSVKPPHSRATRDVQKAAPFPPTIFVTHVPVKV
jgi:hypothetical protein